MGVYDVNRLNRKIWCTTKLPARLTHHIDKLIDVFCDRRKLLEVSVKRHKRMMTVALEMLKGLGITLKVSDIEEAVVV